ncbi:MAG TPA: type I-U CRISPR-associated RAMP protein Csb1/Cas7u [Bryobacteraceae bacterium]|jgi:CRISPR-associated protein Csb1|nr:type I-U CRISPR-associated RAMP protein Csb1/Cas7u [Bryobacteraceae bacterium]
MHLKSLNDAPRLLLEADLSPVAGQRFQPTGFADLGAAEYKLPDGTAMLLVESAQSVANRLEKTCLDGDGPEIEPALAGLPYVVAGLDGAGSAIATSSLVEAHRIGSPYFLLNNDFRNTLIEEMGYNPKLPLDWKKIYATLFKYDTNSLVHGVFLSLLEGGRVRAPRAITGFIEASKVERVVSGGVKNSPVDPTGKMQVVEGKTSESGVYSNVPYARVEYVAERITAYFNLDLALIRGYRLGSDASNLLIALALLKVRRFLDTSLRLRTACDFQLNSVCAKAPADFVLPAEADLLSAVQSGIQACAPLFAKPAVTRLRTKVKIVEKEKAASGSKAGAQQ